MPNWCDTTYVIVGDDAELIRMYYNITRSKKEGTKDEENDYRHIFSGVGLSETSIRERFQLRGDILGITLDLDRHALFIYTCTAWGPYDEDLDEFLSEKYDNLTFYLYAEEPGDGIYINTDIEGKFMPTRYKLSAYIEDETTEEYFNTQDELTDFIGDIVSEEIRRDASELWKDYSKSGDSIETYEFDEALSRLFPEHDFSAFGFSVYRFSEER